MSRSLRCVSHAPASHRWWGLRCIPCPLVTRALISFLPKNIDLSAAINTRMLLFTLAAALLTGLMFGLAPAVRASRAAPGLALKEQSSTVAGGVGLRKALVVVQIGLALVLLSLRTPLCVLAILAVPLTSVPILLPCTLLPVALEA